MPVPTVITSLSATLASNSPPGGESVGTNMDDYLRSSAGFIRQLYDASIVYCGAGSGADTVILTPSPAMVAHRTGQSIAWIQASANTGAVTVNPSSLGAQSVTKRGAVALVAGDLAAGALVIATYDGTRYQVASVTPPTAFSDSAFRIQDNGDTTKQLAFEVSGIAAGTTRTLTAPNYDGTIATLAGMETFVNKTLDRPNIIGTTTNDSAAAGSVGQIIGSEVASGSAVALTTNVTANVTSISLTAGDWDIDAQVAFTCAGTTSITVQRGGVNQTSATLPNPGVLSTPFFAAITQPYVPGTTAQVFSTSGGRISLASTTTIYLVAQATFTVSTCSAFGYIMARRAR